MGKPHPSRIGPYTIAQRLGVGGFGDVYLAEQTTPRRLVAIKILRIDRKHKEPIARFEQERQVLARLSHPAIAKIFEGGRTRDGLPYLVMEYVDGEPITVHCDRHCLSIDERLRLFCSICEAIQHAHHNQVLHRDITPKNILGARGDEGSHAKVIDFGFAKDLGPPSTAQKLLTASDQMMGTLPYASPEQLNPQANGPVRVDTRTDVYSLGAVLYELLVGVPPFEVGGGIAGLVERILKVDPVPPSRKLNNLSEDEGRRVARCRSTSLNEMGRRLRNDLDVIVLKALGKEAPQRYATVNGLKLDIERFLSGLPIDARRPTPSYLATRYVRKHPVGVLLSLMVLLLLVVGLASLFGYRQALHSQRETLRATEDLFLALDSFEPKSLDELHVEDFDLDPLTVAELQRIAGGFLSHNGEYALASDVLRRSLLLFEQELGAGHVKTLRAQHMLSLALVRLGDIREAMELSLTSYEHLSDMLASDTLFNEVGINWLDAKYTLATCYQLAGQGPEALSLFRELIEDQELCLLQSTEANIPPQDIRIRTDDLLQAKNNLALKQLFTGSREDVEDSARRLRDCIQEYVRLFGEEYGETLVSQNNLSLALGRLGRTDSALIDEALGIARDLVAKRSDLLGTEHPHTLDGKDVLAFVLREREEIGEAEVIARSNLTKRIGRDPNAPRTSRAWNRLAILRHLQNDQNEAEQCYREAIARRVAKLGTNDWRVAVYRLNLAHCIDGPEHREEAQTLRKTAHDVLMKYFDTESTEDVEQRLPWAALPDLYHPR